MPEVRQPKRTLPTSDECVVVGSGPGGCVTAYHLAAAGRSVTVLEDGEHLSLDAVPAFSRAEMERKYRNGGLTLAFGAARVQYVEGRCVGGGAIPCAAYLPSIRPPAADAAARP